MTRPDPADLAALLGAAVTAEPGRPQVTYYERRTGERTELSAATLSNWVAKTANFLVDDLDVRPGDFVAVVLPPHWQTAAISLAVWSIGATLTDRWVSRRRIDTIFFGEDRLSEFGNVKVRDAIVTARHPLAVEVAGKPPHVLDFALEVRAHGDVFTRRTPVDPVAAALSAARFTLSYAQLAGAAQEMSRRFGLRGGDRILMHAAGMAEGGPLPWLLAPLAGGSSVVLADFDPGPDLGDWLRGLAVQELATATLGIDLGDDFSHTEGIRALHDDGSGPPAGG